MRTDNRLWGVCDFLPRQTPCAHVAQWMTRAQQKEPILQTLGTGA